VNDRTLAGAIVFVALLGVLVFVGRDYLPKPPNPYAAQNAAQLDKYHRELAERQAAEKAHAAEPWFDEASSKAYIDQAWAVQKIADPLERCLAFPDLPGNHWPAGLARSVCEHQFGPHVDLAQVRERIVAGDYAGLEQRFAEDLDKHFRDGVVDEVIDLDYEAFDGSDASDGLTRTWLQHSPKSAFALAARGQHYLKLALDARGTAYVADTPAEDLAAMERHAGTAAENFRAALAIEPRLLPASTGLLRLAMISSGISADALQAPADPGCSYYAQARMYALQPRWGGSEAEMREYARGLQPLMRSHPLLGSLMGMPDADRADRLKSEYRFEASRALMREASRSGTWEYPAEALSLKENASKPWEPTVYAVAATRFLSSCDFCQLRRRGSRLADREYALDWARSSLEEALKLSPRDPLATIYLGHVAQSQQRWDDADREFQRLVLDKQYREQMLKALTELGLASGRLDDARKYLGLVEAEFPGQRPWIIEARKKLADAEAKGVATARG